MLWMPTRRGREDVTGCRRRPERSGYTFWPAPLHNVALPSGDEGVKIGKLLLEYGADPLLTNKDGETPLDLAKEFSKDQDLIDLLTEATEKALKK